MSRAHKSYLLTPKEKALIFAMYDSGEYSLNEIAGKLNVARSTIRYYVNRETVAAVQKRYYLKNRIRILKYLREYKKNKKHETMD